MKKLMSLVLAVVLAFSFAGCNSGNNFANEKNWDIGENDWTRYNAVKTYLDNVLANGRDTYKDKKGGATPLFLNGINSDNGEPLIWLNGDGEKFLLSNFASQQNLMRTLVGMTNLSGATKYKKAAVDATKYMFKNYSSQNGLLYWGGHAFIDLATGETHFPFKETLSHELKQAYPYYQLLAEVNPEGFESFLTGMWNGHITDWKKLEFNRHATFTKEVGKVWENPILDFPSMFKSRKLPFLDAGLDMYYAAAMYYKSSGNKQALEFSKALANQYVKARFPETGLGGWIYILYIVSSDPSDTRSADRVWQAYGPQLGDNAIMAYGWLDNGFQYGKVPYMGFYLYDMLGEDGREFADWALSGLKAYVKYAYDPVEKNFKPMLADGIDRTGFINEHETNMSAPKGTVFGRYGLDPHGFMALSAAVNYDRSSTELWQVVRDFGIQYGLGDFGDNMDAVPQVNLETNIDDPVWLFAVLDLYKYTEKEEYLNLARKIGDNLVANHFNNGYFTRGKDYNWCWFNSTEAHALLKLHSYIVGSPDAVADYIGSRAYTEGGIYYPNGEKTDYGREFQYYDMRRDDQGGRVVIAE